jgi:hypothetical protein
MKFQSIEIKITQRNLDMHIWLFREHLIFRCVSVSITDASKLSFLLNCCQSKHKVLRSILLVSQTGINYTTVKKALGLLAQWQLDLRIWSYSIYRRPQLAMARLRISWAHGVGCPVETILWTLNLDLFLG